MDLTQLTDEDLAVLANMGNIAAIAEQSRRVEDGRDLFGSSQPFSEEKIQEESFFAPQIPDEADEKDKEIGSKRFEGFAPGSLFKNLLEPVASTTAMEADDTDLDTQAALTDDIIEQQLKEAAEGRTDGILQNLLNNTLLGRTVKGIGNLFQTVVNPKDSKFYRGVSKEDLAGIGGTLFGYTPDELNKMNALGGFYSEPMREFRRRSNRISNMLRRGAAGKGFSQGNLDNLLGQFGFGDEVDTAGMMKSIRESSKTGFGVGDVGGGDTGLGAGGGGRDYSQSPGAMAGDMEYGEE